MASINELKRDLEEVESLITQAKRAKVIDLLKVEERRLNNQITLLTKEAMKKTATETPGASGGKVYQVQIRNYAWDQSNSSVKIYITLKNVGSIPKENILCTFPDNRSFELQVKGLENKDHILVIKKLLEPILPEKCTWKVKSDMVILTLSKNVQTNWSHLTETEKKTAELKAPKFDDMGADKDPSASLMNMMKNLYNTGDDEMKKTIEKSWLQSSAMRGSETPFMNDL